MRLRLICSSAVLALSMAAGPVLAQEATPPPPADAEAQPETPAEPEPAPVEQAPPEAAAAPAPPAEVVDPGPVNLNGGSSYGRFLAGRIAMNRGDSQASSDFFSAALDHGEGERLPRERAFSAAVLAGDIEAAAGVRLTEGESPAALVQGGRLARMVNAFDNRREARRVYRELQAQPIVVPHAWAGGLVMRFLAAETGDWDAALAEAPATADMFTRLFSQQHRAMLLEQRRRYDEADALYRQLMLDGTASPLFRQSYGEFLERRGRRDEAVAVYDAGLAQTASVQWAEARERAARGGRPPAAPTARQGAAVALTQAAAFAVQAEANEFAVAYLRMALTLDPDSGDSWLMLGDALSAINMPTTARDAWASTPRGSHAYLQARVQLAISLDEAGETDRALEVARSAVGAQGDVAAAYALAALLASHDEQAEALSVLDGPILAPVTDNWNLLFLRGAVNEQLGRHDAAEAAFQRALTLSPDSAEIMNYLGYLWIDQGTRTEEGIALVERAVAAEPTSGAYQDSLGWGRYRQGRFEDAVGILEHAVSLDAGSAVINDHLGDAYWVVGREREARYQWNRVLTLDPDATVRAAVEAKLAGRDLPVRP